VKACEGTNARIVDTRKTLPNLRALQKYAVRCGGGYNHRFGLFDGIMIKDNHLAASGSIAEAIETARKLNHHLVKVEVECETEAQVAEALRAGADVILLDNMEPERMARILQEHRGEAVFEASGGVSLETVAEIARTGVDAISVGAITHSAPALAMHLELE
jgi:nicotinate-nucleotide pyrophosphorylase (carboxylating)